MRHHLAPHISPIEIAKTIRSIKGVSQNDTGFSELVKNLIPDKHQDRIYQILSGTEQEDEFAVFCRLMGTCSHLNRMDQNPLIQSDAIAPDFIGTFSPKSPLKKLPQNINVNYRCFIEVKLCQEKNFKISKKDLARRRAYAENYGIPLIFAIKFKPFEKSGLWLVMDSKEIESKGRKVSVENIIDSYSAILFDDYFVFTRPGLHIINYYKKEKTGNKIAHKEYGELCGTYLALPNIEPFEIEERDEVLVNAVLDSFDLENVSTTNFEETTAVVSSIGGQGRLLSNMVYSLNNIAKNEDNSLVYDASRVIASSDSEENPPLLLDRNYIEIVFSILNSYDNLIFFGSIGDLDKNYRRIIRLGS
ncbi:MAG: hypothetical protein WAZ48_07225 [Lysobacteraceae bacterium]